MIRDLSFIKEIICAKGNEKGESSDLG